MKIYSPNFSIFPIYIWVTFSTRGFYYAKTKAASKFHTKKKNFDVNNNILILIFEFFLLKKNNMERRKV